MGRTVPPAAIAAPTSKALAQIALKPSDLPLRNFLASMQHPTQDPNLPSTPPQDTPGLSELETPNSFTEDYIPTPSSTTAEFGDGGRKVTAPAAVMVASQISEAYLRSRSASRASELQASEVGSTPASVRQPRSTTRNQHERIRAAHSQSRAASRELVDRYLQGLPSIDPVRELSLENTSLQQRISGLQRIERDLLSENHNLLQQLNSAKRQNDLRRRKWKEELQEKDKAYQARIATLEDRLAQKDRELTHHIAIGSQKDSLLSDEQVTAWFTTRAASWQTWVEDFVHHDPMRIQSGVHPVQMLELCESVSTFVRLKDEGLPEELVNGHGGSGVKPAHLLLHGMLANFIISEALESPFWVFAALACCGVELESPSILTEDSMSPIGFRMDLATWHNVAPPRSSRLPPMSARLMNEPQGGRPPVGVGGVPALTLNTKDLQSRASDASTPGRMVMENLYRLLGSVQQCDTDMHAWRAQLMRTLSQGGMGRQPGSVDGDERRFLIDCRKVYARKLKDRFLGGAARFLLQDQDAAGIEKLENRLIQEIDMALQFSCQVWSRQEPLRLKGLKDLADARFRTADDTMELCQGQAPTHINPHESVDLDLPPAYHDGHSVVMVVQPVVEAVLVRSGTKTGADATKVLSKARVLVEVPDCSSAYPKSDATPLTAKPIDKFPLPPSLAPVDALSTPTRLKSPTAAQLEVLVTTAQSTSLAQASHPPHVPPKDSVGLLSGLIFHPTLLSSSSTSQAATLLPSTSYTGYTGAQSSARRRTLHIADIILAP